MRFSSFAIVPAGLLSLVHSLPTEGGALSLAGSPESFIEGNNSGYSNSNNTLEARAATCNNAYTLKIFKSNTCSGNPTRTEIQNWPLEAGATDRCINVNSKASLKGLTLQKGVSAVMYMYPKADCPKRSNGFAEAFLPYAQRVIDGAYCNSFAQRDQEVKSYYIKTWKGADCKPY